MFEVILVFWIASVLLATHLGIKKGIGFLGFINGLFLGPLGVLIVMIQKNDNRMDCPSCAEQILKQATICPHCRSDVSLNS